MKEIGGYFGLELSYNVSFLHSDGCCLNSGRNALEYILISLPKIKRIWIPYFTCDVILEPLIKLNIPYTFYSINERLELKTDINLSSNEYLLITNYFGIKDSYIKQLAQEYGERLIVDNAQAYFCEPIKGVQTLYSPRKFVGVPDGGIAFVKDGSGSDIDKYNKDVSYDRCIHLLKRCDLSATEGYNDYRLNSRKLESQPIRQMSELTCNLLKSIDFKNVRKKRMENFSTLNQALSKHNKMDISTFGEFDCPMVYPYYTDDAFLRKKLIDNKIYVATYWPNVLTWCKINDLEFYLTKNILPLPIDQRYTTSDMNIIINTIYNGI